MEVKMKRIVILFVAVMILIFAASCADTENPDVASPSSPEQSGPMKIGVLNGPTGLSAIGMYKNNEAGTGMQEYVISFSGAPDELVGKLTSGEVDVAAVPPNLASIIYNKTGGNIQVLANNAKGVLYIVTNGDIIKRISDLKGKTIFATGQGSIPEYVLQFILEKNGLADDVSVEFKGEHSQLATLVAAGEIEVALLPEPFVTNVMMKNGDLIKALDITQEWEAACTIAGIADNQLVMSSIIAKKDYAAKNRERINIFLDEYSESIQYVNNNPKEAAQYLEEKGLLGMTAAVAEKAIPNSNMILIRGAEMKKMTNSFLSIMLLANPQSIGGELPGDDFYYDE